MPPLYTWGVCMTQEDVQAYFALIAESVRLQLIQAEQTARIADAIENLVDKLGEEI